MTIGEAGLELHDAAGRGAAADARGGQERSDRGHDQDARPEHARLARAVGQGDRDVPGAGACARRHRDFPARGAVGPSVEPRRRRLIEVTRAKHGAVRGRGHAVRGHDGDADLLAGSRHVGRHVYEAGGIAIDRQAEGERLLLRAQRLERSRGTDDHRRCHAARARTDVARRADTRRRVPRELGLAARIGEDGGRETVGRDAERSGDACAVAVGDGEHHALRQAGHDGGRLGDELRGRVRRAHRDRDGSLERVSLDDRARQQHHRRAGALHERRRVACSLDLAAAVGAGADAHAFPVGVALGRRGPLGPDPVAHGVLDDWLPGGVAQSNCKVHAIAGEHARRRLLPLDAHHRGSGLLLARGERDLGGRHARRLGLRAERPFPRGLVDAWDGHACHDEAAAIGMERLGVSRNAAFEERDDHACARQRLASDPDHAHPRRDGAGGNHASLRRVQLDERGRATHDGYAARAHVTPVTDGDEELQRPRQPARHLDRHARATIDVGGGLDAGRRRRTVELLGIPADLENRAGERHRMRHRREAVGLRGQLQDPARRSVGRDVQIDVEASSCGIGRQRLDVTGEEDAGEEDADEEKQEKDRARAPLHDRATSEALGGSRMPK